MSENGFNINFDSLLKQGLAVIDARFKKYEVTNNKYKLVITQIEGDRDSFYPDMMKEYFGADFETKGRNLFDLWTRILTHKLKMSDLLNRDISIKVAALDFYETQEV